MRYFVPKVTVALLILALGPDLLVAGAREPRRDPESQRIRLKYIGDCLAVQTPTRGFELDPLISLRLIPSSIQELAVDLKGIRRYMRLYMPRTLEVLVDGTDVVMLSNSAADYFRPDWLGWISTATESHGLGLLMIGGLSSFGGYNGYIVYPDWGQTQVGAILPVDTIVVNGDGHHDFAFRLSPSIPEDPLMDAFDWKRSPFFFSLNLVSVKPGARLLAQSDPDEFPLLAYQDVGKGSSFAFMTTWGNPWGNEFIRWEYFVDFSADMVYYSAGLEIPDPLVVHEIRMLFEDFQLSQDIIRSIVEFVDRVGGRITSVQKALDAIYSRRVGAEELYIQQDYPGCQEEMLVLLDDIRLLAEDALRAKRTAFIWIYITEWSVVTATIFLSGYFLYSTMIRRRLYRRVASTRTR